MSDVRSIVREYISKHFKLDHFKVTEFPLLPGGIMLEDKTGAKMVWYYDIDREKVVYKHE